MRCFVCAGASRGLDNDITFTMLLSLLFFLFACLVRGYELIISFPLDRSWISSPSRGRLFSDNS